MSTILFLALSTLCILIYGHSLKIHKEEKIRQLHAAGSLASQDFERTIYNNILSLQGLKDRIVESNGDFFKYLENDSRRIIIQNPALKFVEFIDSTGTIRTVVPLEPNKQVIGLDITKIEYRYPDWLKHSEDTMTNITPWVNLTQNGKAFLVDVPIYFNNSFQGTISAGMDFKSQFDNISSKLIEYSILIKDELGTTFYSFNDPNPVKHGFDGIFRHTLKNIDEKISKPWSVQFMYKSEEALQASTSQKFSLFIGILFSLIISLLAYFFLLANKQSQKYENANIKLTALNQELSKERKKADEASVAKTQFLSNMSHEIRTPLSAILSISEILEGQKLEEHEREYLDLMRDSSKTLLNLVNNILQFDKIESGNVKLSKNTFKPKLLIKTIIDIYKPIITDKGLVLVSDIDENSPPNVVIGDLSSTEQIITNLISNATKFTESGRIEIVYEEILTTNFLKVKFCVLDTGIGIENSKIESIFERFTQLDYGVTKKHQGSGLGLAITKRLIDLMNGKIEVTSTLNKGSIFKVELDYRLSKSPIANPKVVERDKDFANLKVLVVDDNKMNQMILVKILSKINILADKASDGDEALKMCASTFYDLIFMDIHMPGKDGFEIAKQIRKTNKESIILGLSADVTQQAIDDSNKSGMNDYLTKPIEQKHLFETLDFYFSE